MGEKMYFGSWRLQYNPKPTPDRRNDWDYWKEGEEETTSGTAASCADALAETAERETKPLDTGAKG